MRCSSRAARSLSSCSWISVRAHGGHVPPAQQTRRNKCALHNEHGTFAHVWTFVNMFDKHVWTSYCDLRSLCPFDFAYIEILQCYLSGPNDQNPRFFAGTRATVLRQFLNMEFSNFPKAVFDVHEMPSVPLEARWSCDRLSRAACPAFNAASFISRRFCSEFSLPSERGKAVYQYIVYLHHSCQSCQSRQV